jgi:phage terminase small subunit
MARALSAKQQQWISYYLGVSRGNATDAARRAGYRDPDGSGFDNRRNPVIAARVEAVLAARTAPRAMVLAELTQVGMAPWQHFVEVKLDKLGRPVWTKMDLSSKVRSLELLGKYHRLFDRNVTLDLAQQFVAALRAFAEGDDGDA